MPQFLNADLEIYSSTSLQPISDAFGEKAFELHCGDDGETGYAASFEVDGIGVDDEDPDNDPIVLINRFCDLIEALPPAARNLWDTARLRIIDLGFQSDEEDNVSHCKIPLATSKRMVALDIELHTTFYPLEGKLF